MDDSARLLRCGGFWVGDRPETEGAIIDGSKDPNRRETNKRKSGREVGGRRRQAGRQGGGVLGMFGVL